MSLNPKPQFRVGAQVTCGIPLIIMDSRHHDLVEQGDHDGPGLEGLLASTACKEES